MAWLRNLPIKMKLIAMMTINTGIAVVIMAICIAMNKAITERDTFKTELSNLAQVIGSRSTSALSFNDAPTAVENLNALAANQSIIYAAMYQQDGALFADFRSTGHSSDRFTTSRPVLKQKLDRLFLITLSDKMLIKQDIRLEGEKIGEINIIASLNTFYRNLVDYLTYVAFIGVACFGVSFIVSTRLHHLISEPVIELCHTTDLISKKNDYSIRLRERRYDEFGMLISGFNHLLEQIQNRDQALALYSTELQSQVAERTQELVESNQKRITWLENMARFLKHELKNSTVGIKTSLELMERHVTDKSLEVYLERVRRSLKFMNVLLTNISNASSLEASVYQESLSPLNFSDFIVSQLNEYHSIYPEFILTDQCEPGIVIKGNTDRLKQMFDKIISNAFEHCRPGTPIRISLSKIDAHAQLSICNDGVRLPENKEIIFDLFVSLRDAEHRKNDNLGLGLYLVKLIAESHDGRVFAEDLDEGEGAMFSVLIPLYYSEGEHPQDVI